MVGDRTAGGLSWLLGADRLESHGHPMTYATLGAPVTCTGACASGSPVVTGTATYVDPYGKTQTAIGGQSLDHTLQDTFKFKLEYRIADTIRARYTLGGWQNHTDNRAQSWLTDAAGGVVNYSPTGDVSISGKYYALGTSFAETHWEQRHWLHALSLTGGEDSSFQWEGVASRYKIASDLQTSSLPQGSKVGSTRYYGQVSRNPYGDGWTVVDLRGLWKLPGGRHSLSFGAHHDHYDLNARQDYTVTANDGSWRDTTAGTIEKAAAGGKTVTDALYLQDAWRIAEHWRAVAGARLEKWQASDGHNDALFSGLIKQADYVDKSLTRTSQKISVETDLGALWTLRAAAGRALRFPTVTELYQSISGPSSLVVNNPDLRPEDATTTELTAQRAFERGTARISIFEERLTDALYSQTTPVAGVGNTTAVSNIDRVTTRGAELAMQHSDVWVAGLDLTGNVTYAMGRINRDALNPNVEGNTYPGIPRWRATLVATWRYGEGSSVSLAARHSGLQFNALANTDTNESTYTSNSPFTVVDVRWLADMGHGWKASVGIDNLFNQTYFAYHPMSQRTVHAEVKYRR
jgi:iron complex outermembrane receptor protein